MNGKSHKNPWRAAVFFALFSVLSLSAGCAKAPPVSPVNITPEGIAIKGYDPVAYFTEKKPVKGSSEFEYVWNGARWRFASAAHRDMFSANPGQYAPRYGGYCAYAVSQGKTADIDPEAWTIFEGKLYLNLNKDVHGLWGRNMEEYIRKADENWHRILGKQPLP